MHRFFLLLLLASPLVTACGQGAITDPLRESFEVDPRPVLGAWAVDLPTTPGTFDALVERDAGTLSGFFEFELWGRWWVVHFSDASWDGQTVRFVERTDFGQREADSLVYWEARYIPRRPEPGALPARIALSASFGPGRNCCIVTMTYYRPEEIPGSARSPSR